MRWSLLRVVTVVTSSEVYAVATEGFGDPRRAFVIVMRGQGGSTGEVYDPTLTQFAVHRGVCDYRVREEG